ncbi:beta-ketoacyl-[acyl-carrier-protein] synthase family protein [Alteromonas sp. ASW11-130]|uniref:beta-ketoacyl-[acyl-carrier-protein] synthase family protein n=1 Tax=Alteromonas sp. ASW11-130 TaxID=3015775 RepID=UPI0022418A27|nr:beta-ketoacyl-[acyl-carrier-protein] synthase family protein [Alteromonas sp. ASW11-130]MCW8090715.1 beta-ketoacyl-[acyl-carrier-protein] synthase family protein [Alteromonas sp. ASW11-130]
MSRVLITGAGIVSALGNDIQTFWQQCLAGKTYVEAIPEGWQSLGVTQSKVYSPLPLPDYKAAGLKKFEITQHDPATLNALVATHQALQHANIPLTQQAERKHCFTINNHNPYRIGVFIGSGSGGLNSLYESLQGDLYRGVIKEIQDFPEGQKERLTARYDALFGEVKRKNTFSLPMFLPNSVAAGVATKYGVKGDVQINVYSCAAGAKAIIAATRAIQNGHLDIALAGGSEYTSDEIGSTFRSFDTLNTLTTYEGPLNSVNRPFDKGRQNFLYSEGGCAMLVLESETNARKRNVSPLAEIVGTAESFDSHHFMQLEPSGLEIKNMMIKLAESASISLSDVNYINAHGTATIANDELESRLLEELYPQRPYINSTKSLLGHTLGASGAIETLVCALSLQQGTMHPSLNLTAPIRPLNFVTQKTSAKLKYAANFSYGFGGHNAGLLLKATN